NYGNFAYTREDVDDHSFISDQLAGSTLVNHRIMAVLDTGLQITPKLSILADAVLINDWHYSPTTSACVTTITGCAPLTTAGDQQFIQHTWFLFDVDYALMDEIDVGVGYYNL